jgi:GT2 family glycosyltransferase
MSNPTVVVTSAAGCSNKELKRTATSLVQLTNRPQQWIVTGSTVEAERVTQMRSVRNSGMHVAINALDLDSQSIVIFLRAGDTLVPQALDVIHQHLRPHPLSDLMYADSSHGRSGRFEEVSEVRRPGWSPERLRSQCYVGDTLIATAQLVNAAGGISLLADLHEHDRALRLSERASNISRISELLTVSQQDRLLPTASLRAVQEHCLRVGIDAECTMPHSVPVVRVSRRLATSPKISVIIPTRGTVETVRGNKMVLAAHAISTLLNATKYPSIEIIAVLDKETPDASRQEIMSAGGNRLRVVDYDRPFNFAEKVNLGAVCSDGEYLLLLNDDTEMISPDALETMVGLLQDPQVAMAGPMLLYEDGLIQSAGHLLNPVPYDLYRHQSTDHVGAQYLLRTQREVSGVIAACALIKRSVFNEAGGLCTKFPSNYNDVDFGLKLHQLGYRTIWTPYAQFFHFESQTRSPKLQTFEMASLGARWRDMLDDDPYSNPHLERYVSVWKQNVIGQRSLLEALGPIAPMASK